MKYKTNPSWCTDEKFCNVKNKEQCKRIRSLDPCNCYNPKMTFFEAREKALNDGCTKVDHQGSTVTIGYDSPIVWDGDQSPVWQSWLAEKEWIIAPQKQTKVIKIPEGAKNIKVHWGDGVTTTIETKDKARKMTYELDYEIGDT